MKCFPIKIFPFSWLIAHGHFHVLCLLKGIVVVIERKMDKIHFFDAIKKFVFLRDLMASILVISFISISSFAKLWLHLIKSIRIFKGISVESISLFSHFNSIHVIFQSPALDTHKFTSKLRTSEIIVTENIATSYHHLSLWKSLFYIYFFVIANNSQTNWMNLDR